jgi:hypothetical protein
MNSAWNDDVLGCGVIFNLPLEIMKSCNQAFIFENLFFLILPLNFCVIYKIVIDFKFNQFKP